MIKAMYDKNGDEQKLEIEDDMVDILNELTNMTIDIMETFQEQADDKFDYLKDYIRILKEYNEYTNKESEVVM